MKSFLRYRKNILKKFIVYGNIFFAIFLVLSLLGCDTKPIFTKIIDQSICAAIPKTAKVSMDEYGVVNIKHDDLSKIEIKIQKITATCQTERGRSLGSDFDGYILIEIYKSGKLAAKAQMDFKTEPTKRDYEKVWSALTSKISWASAK